MKHMKRLALCLLLTLATATSAFAAEIPESFVVENLNGQQLIVKTYTLPPETDPETLKEPTFDYDGFAYIWAYTTKEEQPYLETKSMTQTVTVETAKDDLAQILAELTPSIAYDDGVFSGELALDHTTLKTEAAGYTTKYGSVTETKVISGLDRNDMSYVPATTTKNGQTLKLANVDWQTTATALVGEALVPSQFQAVATYSAPTSWKAATGYVTTAEYHGEVMDEGIRNITYTVVYTGSPIVPAEDENTTFDLSALFAEFPLLAIGAAMMLFLLGVLAVLLFMRRKNVCVYIPGEQPRDYKLVAKYKVSADKPEIDIRDVDIGAARMVAIEIKRPLAKRLCGQTFTVNHPYGSYRYSIVQDNRNDWHEILLKEGAECEKDVSVA